MNGKKERGVRMEIEKTTSHQLLKSINQKKVQHLIFMEGPISRVELAVKTGLTQQTVTNIVNRLLDEDTIVEGAPSVSSLGRKPVPLTIKDSSMMAIGIELAGKYMRGTLCNFRYDPISTVKRSVYSYESEEGLFTTITSVIDQLLRDVPDSCRMKGIGLSIQGLVDSKQGIVLRSPGLGWERFPLAEWIEGKYAMPCYLENDVNLLSLNENMHGCLSGSANNITLKFDYGIGGAIVAGHQLIVGANFVAGELGHYKAFTNSDAYTCHCGDVGCLTTLASTSGLKNHTGLTVEEIAKLARENDLPTLQLFAKIESAIMTAISNTITFLNPDHVLLTGCIFEMLGASAVDNLKERVLNNIPKTCRDVRIIELKEKPNESILAVGLVLKKYFEVPVDSLSL
jgi:transcriptional regulator of PTS gene